MAFEQLEISDSIQVLTPDKYIGASSAFLTLEKGDVRYTYDGTTPTSTFGHYLLVGDNITLKNESQIKSFKAVRIANGNGLISVTYE